MNAAMSVVALVAFIFSTISVLSELFSANRASRMNKRVRRIYLVLLGGLVTSLLASAFVDGVSALHSLLFTVFYIGFIPLAARIAQPEEIRLLKNGRPAKTAADVILFICLAVFVLFFALSVRAGTDSACPPRRPAGCSAGQALPTTVISVRKLNAKTFPWEVALAEFVFSKRPARARGKTARRTRGGEDDVKKCKVMR